MHDYKHSSRYELGAEPPNPSRLHHPGLAANTVAPDQSRVDADDGDPYARLPKDVVEGKVLAVSTSALSRAVLQQTVEVDRPPTPSWVTHPPKDAGVVVAQEATHESLAVADSKGPLPDEPTINISGELLSGEPKDAAPPDDTPQDPPIDKPPTEGAETADQPDPNVDVYEAKRCKILVSRDHGDPELIERLQREDGDFSSWPRIPTDQLKLYNKDREVDPRYFAKFRTDADDYRDELDRGIRKGWIKAEHIPEYEPVDIALRDPRVEFAIANQVERLLDDPEVQATAIEFGYKSISIVKPAASVQDRATGDITMIYPMVQGKAGLETVEGGPTIAMQKENLRNLSDELLVLFGDHGIMPMDLNERQFMIRKDEQGNEHLLLIDPERYYFTTLDIW
jgi:hypothetical protein